MFQTGFFTHLLFIYCFIVFTRNKCILLKYKHKCEGLTFYWINRISLCLPYQQKFPKIKADISLLPSLYCHEKFKGKLLNVCSSNLQHLYLHSFWHWDCKSFALNFPFSIHANSEKVVNGSEVLSAPKAFFLSVPTGAFQISQFPRILTNLLGRALVGFFVLPTLQTTGGKNNGLLATEAANEPKRLRPVEFSAKKSKAKI